MMTKSTKKPTGYDESQPVTEARRAFLQGIAVQTSLAATLLASAAPVTAQAGQQQKSQKPKINPNAKATRATLVKPNPLPFAENALAPLISAQTFSFHYGKHYIGYCDNVAKAVAGSPLEGASLEQIVTASANDPAQIKLFNNAAQAWNHVFYWNSLSPKPQAPKGALLAAIERDFGNLENLKTTLATAATGHFGSGWAWLVSENGKLKVTSTSDADTPLTLGQNPLLTIDVWEHAYYLDYQNRRADHVKAVIEKTLNWDFAAENMKFG